MDCRDPDVVYTAEIQGWRVQKNTLRPEQMRSPSND
jgi:hypothetical protein